MELISLKKQILNMVVCGYSFEGIKQVIVLYSYYITHEDIINQYIQDKINIYSKIKELQNSFNSL